MECIEQIVKKDSHILEIRYHPYFIPLPNYLLFDRDKHTFVNQSLNTMQTYLLSPLIIDDFGQDHFQRKLWRTQMENTYPSFHQFYQRNKLRGNHLRSVSMFIGLLYEDYVGKNASDCYHLIKEASSSYTSDYPDLHLPEKINCVLSFDKKILELLN